jgi:predicted porin
MFEGRNSNVGLTSKNWGTIKLGSFGSVHDDYNGYSEAGGMGWGNSALAMLTTVDARNATVEYISPNLSGLEFKLGASTQYGRTIKWYDFLNWMAKITGSPRQDRATMKTIAPSSVRLHMPMVR